MSGEGALLSIEGLEVAFETGAGPVPVVRGVDLRVGPGRTVALVGESGCGKSVTALSVLGLLDPPGRVRSGRILFRGRDLVPLPQEELRRIRGRHIAMVFQEPMTSLNPVFRVGDQIGEVLRIHLQRDAAAAREESIALLRRVGIPSPEKRVDSYPHELSGGMKQRVMIAMALACRPDLLIADEPTTALDVTIQAQILALLRELQEELGMAVLLITHNLGVVAHTAQEVAVMYAGRIVERSPVRELFEEPAHPYTRALLRALPGRGRGRLEAIPGTVPSPLEVPPGCPFADRCPDVLPHCAGEAPPRVDVGPGHDASCWLHAPREAS